MRTALLFTQLNHCNNYSWPDSRHHSWKKMEICFLKVKKLNSHQAGKFSEKESAEPANPYNWKWLSGDVRAMSSSILGKNIRMMEHSQNKGRWTLLNNKRAVFIIDKQLHQLREPIGSGAVCARANQRNANTLPEVAGPILGSSSAQCKGMKTECISVFWIIHLTLLMENI